MKTFQLRRRVNKLLSVLVIYALVLNELIPFSHAMYVMDTSSTVGKTVPSWFLLNENSNVSTSTPIAHDQATTLLLSNLNLTRPVVERTSEATGVTITTSGPGQAETSGFSINSTDGMVNKFTGDFSYSIPLMDVEGYPIVLSYNSNVSMLQEASWVGLGWDLNVGAISREMRGIPDEFNGTDEVVITHNELTNNTVGEKKGGYAGVGYTFGGFFTPSVQVTALVGKYTNDYLGLGKTVDIGLGAQFSIADAGDGGQFLAPSHNMGFSYDSKNGIGTSQSIGISGGYGEKGGMGIGGNITFGQSSSTRQGLLEKSMSIGFTASQDFQTNTEKSASYGSTTTMTYGSATQIPRVRFKTKGSSDNEQFDLYASAKINNFTVSAGYLSQNYTSEAELILESGQKLYQPAYGYLHSGKRIFAGSSSNAIMDFNRGNDSEFSEEMKNLAFSIQTHDVFYVNASGIGGTFRPQRKDYGTYYDADSESLFNKESELLVDDDQTNISLGLLYDVSKPITIGFGIGYSTGIFKGDINSGNWKDVITNILEFTPIDPQGGGVNPHSFDPAVFFKAIGEPTPVKMKAWETMSGNTADYFDVNKSGSNLDLTNELKVIPSAVNSTALNSINPDHYAATVFNPYTVNSALGLGETKYVAFESPSGGGYSTSGVDINRNHTIRKDNHISMVEVISPDGTTYKYGIPVYNVVSSQVSFACTGLTADSDNGMVIYAAGSDNWISNTRGRSHYFDKTEVPAYAHSFLLTEMVSSDYIDRTGNGPTLDDIGSYYKFNHTRVYDDGANSYKWRFPVSGGDPATSNFPIAHLARGVLGSDLDDMGHYSYGEKEIWYTNSVESKNFIAQFHLEDREDAYGVVDENGDLDEDQPLKLLDKIVLYNKNDLAKPIQTIHFIYDYTLCQDAPGHFNTYNGGGNSGKLTLKEIRVYNGTSKEGALTKYSFEYSDVNPPFSYADADGWGNYKPNSTNRPTDIFPYSVQNESLANSYSRAWKLVAVNNPSGGRMEVAYEADRYGYVQHKRAMRHFDVHGMTNIFQFLKIQDETTWNGSSWTSHNYHTDFGDIANFASTLGLSVGSGILNNALFLGSGVQYINKFGKFDLNAVPNNVVVFQLETPLSDGDYSKEEASAYIKDAYFKDPSASPNAYLKSLMFKMHVNIKTGVDELVQQVAAISNDYPQAFGSLFGSDLASGFEAIGVMPKSSSGDYEYGYVVLDPVNTGDREGVGGDGADKVEKGSLAMNPLQLMSLDFARQYLLDQVYGSCDGCDPDLSLDWGVFFGQDLYEKMIKDGGYSASFIDDFSTVRLFEPDTLKFGGNARVKAIKYFDKWDVISSEYASEYLWEYRYTKPVIIGEDTMYLESGVASFEGANAIDENSLYDWDSYVNIKKKFPDERKFTPLPVAQQLYPIQVVGYENVEVFFNGENKYGHSAATFHTYKSSKYRTKSRQTTIDKTAEVTKKNIITGETKELLGITQGYVVETNDFHGKPDRTKIFDRNGKIISQTTYDYYELGEAIPMVDRDGSISYDTVATEFDIHTDSRYVSDKTTYKEAGLKIKIFYTPPIQFSFGFDILYNQNSRERGFYTNTLIKHINRSAVVKGITTEYLGSVNHAENILFDKYTGNPVLTSLNDEFEDTLYSMSYPSHWRYRELRELNDMDGYTTSISVDVDGNFIPGINDKIAPGDYIRFNPSGPNYYVTKKYPWPEDGTLFLLDAWGDAYDDGIFSGSCIVIRSNRKNRLNETMQNVVSKTIPYSTATESLIEPVEVISSSAITYRDKLSIACGQNTCEPQHANNNEIYFGNNYIPYKYGVRGDLVTDGQYAWQSSRENLSHDHGIRFDGAYSSDFVPFYDLNTTDDIWYPVDNDEHPSYNGLAPLQNWRKLSEVTVFNRFGNALEAKDQIGIYSSILYGYSNAYSLVPIAQAVNARQQDIAFDGFEDYNYFVLDLHKDCAPSETHFDFMEQLQNPEVVISTDEKHSGLASLRIAPSTVASVVKKVSDDFCSALDAFDDAENEVVAHDSCACIKPFMPTVDNEYVIGAWINQQQAGSGARIHVNIGVLSGPDEDHYFAPSGPILDGWQRLDSVFELPANAVDITVSLENNNETEAVYFDDLRIHPFLAGMTTVVYDPKTLLPMATHDGYNFTTFYNYDENLNQVRVRVETIEGIRTIVERESGGQKPAEQ